MALEKEPTNILSPILGGLGLLLGWEMSSGFFASIGNAILGMILGLIAGLIIFEQNAKKLRAKRQQHIADEKSRQEHYLCEQVDQHIDTLARKRLQLRRINEYGAVDDKAWRMEMEVFRKSTLFRLAGDEALFADWEIQGLIDRRVEAYQNDHLQIDYDDTMSGHDYEYFCAELIKQAGWEARVTQGSGDQGVDVVASKEGKTIAIQCKKYTSPVGNKAVQEVHAGKGYIDAEAAVVVTNSTFTPSAIELAQSLGVTLMHHTELARVSEL